MKLLYHACGWVFEEDASKAAMANECPSCGRHSLAFVYSPDPQTLIRFCRSHGLAVPAWLHQAMTDEISQATKQGLWDAENS